MMGADEKLTLELSADEVHGVWAALVACCMDVHAPQDMMTAAQWDATERILELVTARVEAIAAARAKGGE